MEIVNTLAFLIAAAVRPPKLNLDVENTKLQAQVNKLTRERDDARLEADRWRALARRWEVRYETLRSIKWSNPAQSTGPDYGPLQRVVEREICNCAPARHDMLLRS